MEAQGQGSSLYAAFGDYDNIIRQRQFEISQKEDIIQHRTGTLKDLKKENEVGDGLVENIRLQAGKVGAEFQRDQKKKERLEEKKLALENELDVWKTRIERRHNLLQHIESETQKKVQFLTEKNKEFEIGYLKLPGVKEYVQASSECEKLEEIVEEEIQQLSQRQNALKERKEELQSNWLEFTQLCISISRNKQEVKVKEKERNELNYRLQKWQQAEKLSKNKRMETKAIQPTRRPTYLTSAGLKLGASSETGFGLLPERTQSDPNLENASVSNLAMRLQKLRTSQVINSSIAKKISMPSRSLHDLTTLQNIQKNNGTQARAAAESSFSAQMKAKLAARVVGAKEFKNGSSSKPNPNSVISEYLKQAKTKWAQPRRKLEDNEKGSVSRHHTTLVNPKMQRINSTLTLQQHLPTVSVRAGEARNLERGEDKENSSGELETSMDVEEEKERVQRDDLMDIEGSEGKITLNRRAEMHNSHKSVAESESSGPAKEVALFKTPLPVNRPPVPVEENSGAFGFGSNFFSGMGLSTPDGSSSDQYSLFGSLSSTPSSDTFEVGGTETGSAMGAGGSMGFLDLFGDNFNSSAASTPDTDRSANPFFF